MVWTVYFYTIINFDYSPPCLRKYTGSPNIRTHLVKDLVNRRISACDMQSNTCYRTLNFEHMHQSCKNGPRSKTCCVRMISRHRVGGGRHRVGRYVRSGCIRANTQNCIIGPGYHQLSLWIHENYENIVIVLFVPCCLGIVIFKDF